MPTKKRYVETGTVKHDASGIKVPYEFDRDEKVFRATYAGQTYTHKEAVALEHLVHEAIGDSLNVPWMPIIRVTPLAPGVSGQVKSNFVGFQMERLWIAQFPDRGYKSCQWDGAEKGYLLVWCRTFHWDEKLRGPFTVPRTVKEYNNIHYYLPHTEELWARLQELEAKIIELHKHLTALFEDANVVNMLLNTSPLLSLPFALEPIEQ